MEFTALTDDERRQIIGGHLKQAEADYLQAVLNASKARAAADDETDADRKRDAENTAARFDLAASAAARDVRVVRAILDEPTALDVAPDTPPDG